MENPCSINGKGTILETIDELVERTKLPKSWWYRQTMQTGPGSVPRLKVRKYLRFVPSEVDLWLKGLSQGEEDTNAG